MQIEQKQLPDGWNWLKLGDVCDIVCGTTPSSDVPEYWNGDICWVTPKDLGKLKSKYIDKSERMISKLGYDSCGTELVQDGAVVMSTRAPIGHLAIAKSPLCTNQGCKVFIPKDNLHSEYLYYTLKKSIPDLQALGS